MRILDAKVYDYPALGWANLPHLQVLVDSVPDWKSYQERVYRTAKTSDMIDLSSEQTHIVYDTPNPKKLMKFQEEGTAYFSETDGYVHFFFHNPKNESGFGGSVHKGRLEDGTEFSVKGPWSSNSSAMRILFGVDTLDVSMTDDPDAWKRGYTFYGGHITLEVAKQAIPFILPDFTITDEEPYLTRLTPLVPQYPEGSPNWHRREYQRKKESGTLNR